MTAARWAIHRAADAPAPTLVIDGSMLCSDASRQDLQGLVVEVRTAVLSDNPVEKGLGVKTVVIRPTAGPVLLVEFFQGFEHGPLMLPSPLTCINSLGCGVVVSRTWFPQLGNAQAVVAVMGGIEYILRRESTALDGVVAA